MSEPINESSADFVFETAADLRSRFQEVIAALTEYAERGCEVVITTLDLITWEQRKLLNATLGDIAKQVRLSDAGHYVNITKAPFGEKLSKDEWRGVFMAKAMGQRVVPDPIDQGQYVSLSKSSKKLSKRRHSIAMEMIWSFGADCDVQWSDPRYKEYLSVPEASRRLAA